MKYCAHCGKQVADNSEICMNCGCRVTEEYNVTFKRDSQWFLINPAVNIDINGQHLSIKSGEIISVKLKADTYNCDIYGSLRRKKIQIDLNRDITIRIAWNRFSGALEVWEI